MPAEQSSPRTATFVPRLEDERFLTGRGEFVADVEITGMVHAVVVRADHAHADIRGIDCSAALEVPGVLAVHTEDELRADGLGPLPCMVEVPSEPPMVVPPRYALARGRVRHVGDPVAFVVAETMAAAAEAAEAVIVDTAPLPAVATARDAQAPSAPILWETSPGNRAFRFEMGDQDTSNAAFAAADHVAELDIINNRVIAQPLEPRAGIGMYDASTDTYTLNCTGQGLHGIRDQMAESVLKVPADRIRVTAPDVGGGFGMKNFLYPEWVLLLWAARRHRRPVKWVAERAEDMSAAAHGRDVVTRARLALDAAGKFLALEAALEANMGAYLSAVGPGPSTRAAPTAMGGVYAIPVIHMTSVGVFTNTAPVDAYRGAGKPEANFIIERLIDTAARRFGFDPVALRLRNAIDTYPHTTAQGMQIDSGRIRSNIEDAAARADRTGFEKRRADAAAARRLRGLGFGCFLETARGTPEEGAEVRFAADGLIELCMGTESNGQGHETAFPQIAAARLGLPLDSFRFVQADTAATRMGHGHGGARSMHMGGGTLAKALDAMLEKAQTAAGQLLQTPVDGIAYVAGTFSATASGQSVSLVEVAAAANLDTFVKTEDAPFTFPNGCHACEVEIDPETGVLTIERYVAVDDYGELINPALAMGQVLGGVVQGIGQAIGENALYDRDTGQLLAGTLMDYYLPPADHLPGFEVHLEGVPTQANPLGVKGTGQAGAIAAPQAVVNAVVDALAPLGIDHVDMPLTSENLWRVIRSSSV